MSELHVCHLGEIEYREGVALQERVRTRVQEGELPDVLLLLEHPPVYTRGRRSDAGRAAAWARTGTARRASTSSTTDRGGKLTYHGPGQLVGYPIMRDHRRRRATCARWSEAIVAALAEEGIDARGAATRARLHRRLGRGPQDRLDRRARLTRRHHARLRRQRRQRPAAVRRGSSPAGCRRAHDLARRGDRRRRRRPATCFRRADGARVLRRRSAAASGSSRPAAARGRDAVPSSGVSERLASIAPDSLARQPGRDGRRCKVLGADVRPFREPQAAVVQGPAARAAERYRELTEHDQGARTCTRSARRPPARTSASAGSAAPRRS